MPIVRIEIGEHSKEQKRELIQKVSKVVVEVLKEPKSNCMVLLKEIPDENWGVGGETVEELEIKYRK